MANAALAGLLLSGVISIPTLNTNWNFLQSIGVNTHMDWQNPGSGYASPAVVESSIAYLGARRVRDGVPYPYWTLPEYAAIAQQGVVFDIIGTGLNVDIEGDIADVAALLQAAPGSVTTMEGVNEYTSSDYQFLGLGSLGNPGWIQTYGPALYAAVQAAPALAGVQVVAASIVATPGEVQQEGAISSFIDYNNWHCYYGAGAQPGATLAADLAEMASLAPGKPAFITETGYYTAVKAMAWGGGGVNLPTQAVLTLNTLFDSFSSGVTATYLYELMDNISNPPSTDLEDSFGLFFADGSPKPAATALHNLTSILADNGAGAASFTPVALPATARGLPATAHIMALARSDGGYDIIVWNEPQIWNEATQKPVTPPSTSFTLNFPATESLQVFNPIHGTTPTRARSRVKSTSFLIGADPLIIEVAPAG